MPVAILRVLIVDDDLDDRRLLVDLLSDAKRATFVVDEADTSSEAFKKLQETRYDVVFVDFRLTGDISGLEFIKTMKAQHYRAPVILITNQKDRRLQADALAAGAAEFLEKGAFNADLLERTCVYAIGIHTASQESQGGAFGEIIALTRDAVQAQVRTADEVVNLRQEMSQLRAEIGEDIKGLESHVDKLREHADKQKEDIIAKLSEGTWGRIEKIGSWVIRHPFKALFIGFALVLLLGILAFEAVYLGPDILKMLLPGFAH